jgi:glycosyltransferase AglD
MDERMDERMDQGARSHQERAGSLPTCRERVLVSSATPASSHTTHVSTIGWPSEVRTRDRLFRWAPVSADASAVALPEPQFLPPLLHREGARPMISVVMPAHNEEDLLTDAVESVVAGLDADATPYEVVVVENGSRDRTWTIALDLQQRFPQVRALQSPEADYGRALRTGFLAASGGIVVSFDVDFCDLGFLRSAVKAIEEPGGPAVVVGTKRGAGSSDTRPFPRRLVTGVFSRILKIGFGLKVSDTHGIKAFRRSAITPIVERCEFGTDIFDTELVLRAERAGLRTDEIPVAVEELRPARSSIARRIPRTLKNLARLRIALWRRP